MKPQRVEISYKTIVFIALFSISLYVLWQVRSLIYLFLFCFILMEALNPAVTKLEKIKIPRPFGILFVYAVILAVFSFTIASVFPILVEQTTGLIKTFPQVLENFRFFGFSAVDLSSQFKLVENLPENIAKTIISIFSNIFSAFVVLVITFYLLIERKNISKYSFQVFGSRGKRKTIAILEELEIRLGSWVNAEIFLMIVIGILSYVGYTLLGLNYAVPLAILAGIFEIIPNIGPTVATLLAALVGLTVSPLMALLAIIVGTVIQQLENNFIVPKIMKSTIGLNPLITILLLVTGAKLGNVTGAILAIPVYLTIETIAKVLARKS